MTIAEFKKGKQEAIIEQWHNAEDGILLEDTIDAHYIKLGKQFTTFHLLISRPAGFTPGKELDTRCGCPYHDQWHWHHWESYLDSRIAYETVAWAISAIEHGVMVKLTNSSMIPF